MKKIFLLVGMTNTNIKGVEKEAEKSKPQSYGKPKLGGDYTLTDSETGKPFGSDNLKGKFTLIYFGFTHCPDICPEELDKMAEIVDETSKFICFLFENGVINGQVF